MTIEKLNFKNGKIIYDDFDIDLSRPLDEQIFSLKEDLLQAEYGKYILDIG